MANFVKVFPCSLLFCSAIEIAPNAQKVKRTTITLSKTLVSSIFVFFAYNINFHLKKKQIIPNTIPKITFITKPMVKMKPLPFSLSGRDTPKTQKVRRKIIIPNIIQSIFVFWVCQSFFKVSLQFVNKQNQLKRISQLSLYFSIFNIGKSFTLKILTLLFLGSPLLLFFAFQF